MHNARVPTSAPRFRRRSALAAPAIAAALGTAARATPTVRAQANSCALPPESPPADRVDCTSDGAAMAGIKASLDARADALERGDRDAFLATLDLRNLTWRRIQSEYFDGGGSGRRTVLRGTPISLQAKPGGYVRATIEFARPGGAPTDRGHWVFHPGDDGSWRHAEPLNDDLGPRRSEDRGAFVLSHYDWDADVLDRVAAVASTAWSRVGRALPLPAHLRPTISLNPTFASHSGLRGSTTWAAYLPGSRGTVLLRSPESYGSGTSGIDENVDEKLLVPLTHEMTHLVNDDIVSIVRIPHWMSEGLAEHVADHVRRAELSAAVRAGRTWTLDKASEVIEWGTDPARDYTSADVSLAYAHAAHGVRYLVERFGMDAFWKLAAEYAASRTWDRTFVHVIGITWEAFGNDWSSWLQDGLG